MIPGISEAVVRSQTTRQSFARGREYFEHGAVLSLARRGRAIKAEVEGNEFTPYQIRIEFDAGGVTSAYCTCAYAWRGWCKHVVAVALACVYTAPELTAMSEPEAMLAELDRGQLSAILRNMLGRNPRLARQIQREADRLRWDSRRELLPGEEGTRAKDYERRVGALIHSLDYMPSAEAYWYVGGVIRQLGEVLDEATQYLGQSEARSALQVLEGLISAYVEEWTVLDDSDGIVSEFWYELDDPLTQALLGAQLSTSDRRYWTEVLYNCINELGFYGVDDAFERSLLVVEAFDGGGTLEELAEQEEVPAQLVAPLLDILDRRGEHDRYLAVASRSENHAAYVLKLIGIRRVNEAVAYGREQQWTADDALVVARALVTADSPDEAIEFALEGLRDTGDRTMLVTWLQEFAVSTDRYDLAVQAVTEGLRVIPSLDAYRRLQLLAGENWPELREDVLNAVRTYRPEWTNPAVIDILLYEGLVEDAIVQVGEHPDPRILARVVEKAIPVRPGWAIRQSLAQAMLIIEQRQSRRYGQAIEWLRRARDAHRAAGREADWQQFIDELRRSPHARKHKLMGMLDKME